MITIPEIPVLSVLRLVNFVRVLIRWRFAHFSVKNCWEVRSREEIRTDSGAILVKPIALVSGHIWSLIVVLCRNL